MESWDYEGYWQYVLGNRNAPTVVEEFALDPNARVGLSEWLGEAEAEAWRVGAMPGVMPAEWAAFHARALAELAAASS